MPHVGRRALACLLTAIGLTLPLAATGQQGQTRNPAGNSAEATPPVVMICAFEDATGTGWVPEVVILTRQANGRIEVFDTILQALVGRPIEAKITADSRRLRTYGWALAGVRNEVGQRAERLDYRLTVTKPDARADMTIQAQGYDNTITGHGICGQPSMRSRN